MRLYHYTTPENGLSIAMLGLHPSIKNDAPQQTFQTMGVPVVWLTREQSNIATAADVAHFAKYGVQHKGVGWPCYGGKVRCVVEVERSRHLTRWTEFLRTTKIVGLGPTGRRLTGRDVLATYDIPRCQSWWISTQKIPASKVWVPLTRAQAIAACEYHMSTHPSAECREQFKQQRDKFAEHSNDVLFGLHNGECCYLFPKAM